MSMILNLMRRKLFAVTFALLAASLHADFSFAQEFPTKVVRLVVPFGAGGTADITARRLGELLSAKWKQPVIIENKPGAGSIIGGVAVSTAAPDGYTMLIATDQLLTTMHLMAKNPRLNPSKDFAPVVTLLRFPMAIAVGSNVPVKSLAELSEYAKKNPVNYGSLGIGTAPHLTTEMFLSLTNAPMVQVPYRSIAQMTLALTTGEVQVIATSPGTLAPLVSAGNARILAVDGKERFPLVASVPTFTEAGFSAMRSASWWAIVTPPNTPPGIVAKLNKDINEAMQDPNFIKFLKESGFEPVGGSAADLASLMVDTEELWKPIIKKLNIQLDE